MQISVCSERRNKGLHSANTCHDEYFNQLRITAQLQMSHDVSYSLFFKQGMGFSMIMRFLKPGWIYLYICA